MKTSEEKQTAADVQAALEMQPCWDESRAAEFLGLSDKTMQAFRWKKTGPRYLKLGAAVRYRPIDLYTYAASKMRETRDSQSED